ncbi:MULTISPECIES: UxaA family hydrolase [Thermodesulfovibrio]|uniref:Altronate dehydratase large subunit n=2 Tax=Thermodesulfovibrio TaxID=28261 RepID=A0A0U9HN56_9BACT|nr:MULTISPECIES: UxaA family hydrolase [Thermodesulfovibrio]GAQ94504.1 altronate dehydratase large subunit [Thermodesulfovibrio aggregans]GLI52370.1 carbohydrate hydrolase [Thermodesulfovibrio islandicus]
MKIRGFIRPDGGVGIRNHLLIIPTVVCASTVAERIASFVEGAISLANQHGCCQIGADLALTENVLIGLGKNPNVGAVLVVSLECGGVSGERMVEEISKTGKPVEYVGIQKAGGSLKAIDNGTRLAQKLAQELLKMEREDADISEIILSVECGGSDTTSGLASNPVAGYVVDKIIELGATGMFSETTEVIGAEHLLAKRAVSKEVAEKLIEMVKKVEEKAKTLGVDIRGGQPTPGNIEGGISTIEEKSLGAIYKGGTKPLQGVLDYGEKPFGKGLYFMDTPGQDIESITGMTAGGSQVVIFTTGRGTPTGSPIAPVIKITGNPETYKLMEDNIDFYCGTIIEGIESIEEAGERLFKLMIEVINGRLTKAEALKHREFGMFKLVSTF